MALEKLSFLPDSYWKRDKQEVAPKALDQTMDKTLDDPKMKSILEESKDHLIGDSTLIHNEDPIVKSSNSDVLKQGTVEKSELTRRKKRKKKKVKRKKGTEASEKIAEMLKEIDDGSDI